MISTSARQHADTCWGTMVTRDGVGPNLVLTARELSCVVHRTAQQLEPDRWQHAYANVIDRGAGTGDTRRRVVC
jgi:hypothetical protein